jgi:peptide/nickel transport system permease protein
MTINVSSRSSGVFRKVRSRPSLSLTVGLLGLIVLACAIGPLLIHKSPTELSSDIFAGPSSAHWFGTDDLGRDMFSRMLVGGRLSLTITAGATAIAMVIGCIWGMLAALRGKFLDELLMRLADVSMAVPQVLLALVLVAAFGASRGALILTIGLLLSPVTARVVRSVALAEMSLEYFPAAIAYGARTRRLLFVEMLPNTASSLMVQAVINAANALLIEATLSFLGLGIQPPDASWGTLLQEGYANLYTSTWGVLFPGALIFSMILLLNVLGNQVGAALDPKSRIR